MNKLIVLIIGCLLFLPLVMASDPAFYLKQNSQSNLTLQVLNSDNSVATAGTNCTLSIKDSYSRLRMNDGVMSYVGNGYFTKSLSGIIDNLGLYSATLNCNDGSSNYLASNFYFKVTATGDTFDSLQGYMVFAQLGVIALFVVLGFSFSKERWKIRSLFFMAGLLMGIITLNSIRIIAGGSNNLTIMGNVGLILGIIILSFMFMYLLIFYTVEIFKYFKEKRRMRWEVSNNYG